MGADAVVSDVESCRPLLHNATPSVFLFEVGMSRNARLGLVLFFIYLALYGGFVFLPAFAPPETMEWTPPGAGGINIAILYGFGLIIAALLMSLLYGALAADESTQPASAPHASKEGAGR